MTPTIQILSDETIDQIAAGEVIENPASVVKELIENAIDAGSRKIGVEISWGGLQLIRVVDDGCGMSDIDASLALKRHATSKIRHFSDLFSLSTMGFRGEALAAIAAISELTLITAQGKQSGIKIQIKGGRPDTSEVFPRARGTTLEVRSLFYNTPARRKFQKSAAASAAEIVRLMTSLALAHPEIGFELIQGNKKMLSSPPKQQLSERIALLLGEEFQSSLIKIDMQDSFFRIEGYISSPSYSRPNRTGQHLFINHRAIVCPAISYALKDGYGTRLDPQRYPLFVLHLTLPGEMVDVNVHPQKREVRLKEEIWIKKKICEAVQQSLGTPQQTLNYQPFDWDKPQDSLAFVQHNTFSDSLPLRFKEEFFPAADELPLIWDQHNALGVFQHFLLLEERGKLLIVDLYLARFRILFEQLLDEKKSQCPHVQGLLVPLTFHVPSSDAILIESHLPLISRLGIGIRPLGKDGFIIDALPTFMETAAFPDLLFKMMEGLQCDLEEEKQRELARLAAHSAAARKSGFMLQEARALFEELMRTSAPHQSPYGTPIMIALDGEAIHDLFRKKR